MGVFDPFPLDGGRDPTPPIPLARFLPIPACSPPSLYLDVEGGADRFILGL